MDIKNKVAVVTGASYGLGKSISKILLKKGTRVYGLSRTDPEIENPIFTWIKIDLTLPKEIALLPNKINEDKIDILVNNVGTAFTNKSLKFNDEDFETMFSLNFKAPIRVTSVLCPKINNGLVINISSTSDRFAEDGWGLYCASKAALNIYFETVGIENKGMKVINMLPTYINTPLLHKLYKKEELNWNDAIDSNEVAKAIFYVIDNAGEFDSGTKIMVVSDKLMEDTIDPEKLWYYNVDTGKVAKLK
jgi:short-subunit dehydrogenase